MFDINPTVAQFKQRAVLHNPPSPRLFALLAFTKTDISEKAFSWTDVAAALGELYHPKMTVSDAMHHLVAAFQELKADPRFEAGHGSGYMTDVLLAPVKGFHSIERFGPKQGLASSYTVEQFYDAMAGHMLTQIRLARVDWLVEPGTPA